MLLVELACDTAAKGGWALLLNTRFLRQVHCSTHSMNAMLEWSACAGQHSAELWRNSAAPLKFEQISTTPQSSKRQMAHRARATFTANPQIYCRYTDCFEHAGERKPTTLGFSLLAHRELIRANWAELGFSGSSLHTALQSDDSPPRSDQAARCCITLQGLRVGSRWTVDRQRLDRDTCILNFASNSQHLQPSSSASFSTLPELCMKCSMLARQQAGAFAPCLYQSSQQLEQSQQCWCSQIASLRRPQLAAATRHRQLSAAPSRMMCTAAAAAPPAEQVDTVEGPSLDSSGKRAVTAPAFPFVRLAGQEDMKLSLLLNVIDSRIGGVLIMGDRGTGKSVAVSSRRMHQPIVLRHCSDVPAWAWHVPPCCTLPRDTCVIGSIIASSLQACVH